MNKTLDWKEVKDIFAAALEIEPERQESFVAEQCKGDEYLRAEVESWLTSHSESGAFMETPFHSVNRIFSNGLQQEGRQFGSYRIIRELGHGGMGVVFLAERTDGEFEQQVALKIVRQSIADTHMLERFRLERQILASLNHPNIAKLLDGGVSGNGEPFLAMEYVEGCAIGDFAQSKDLNIREKLGLFLKVCSAVAYAHRNLVVHRDLKPANILVNSAGEPKLLDFGLAKLIDDGLGLDMTETRTEFRALTPAYASPEQLNGETITTASDVYSLGVVLYELLTGERPFKFEGMSLDEIIRAISTEGPGLPSRTTQVNSNLRGDLDNIILKSLKSEAERRYSSVEQLAEDIQRHLDGLPVTARKDTFRYRASKFVIRHRGAVVAGLLVLMAVFIGITMTVREKRKADRRFNDVRQLANSLMFEVDSEIQKSPTKGRAMIARRALEYLDSLALESGNESDLQLELAAGYLKVGDIQGKPYRPNLGDTSGAAASYRKAQVLLESLTTANPSNREALRYLSLSYQSLGRVQQRNSEWDQALESERHAVVLSENLVAADPTNAKYRYLLADNYLHFGEALYSTGRGATIADDYQAIEYFRKALAIHSSLSAAEPENAEYQYATGVDYEYVGIAFNLLGDRTGDTQNHLAALENHSKELEINEALAASDPSNAAYRRIVADVYGEVGLSQLRLGRTAEGLTNFRRKLTIFESIKASDPTNVEAIRDVVNSLVEISNALKTLNQGPEALLEMRKAVALQQTLCDAEPANAETRSRLQRLSEAVTQLQNDGHH
ncbi:MAG: protein kinase domain-containing protein [Pyrinomonadaceae bacterium]